MNSQCSNQPKGWLCIRAQHLEKIYEWNAASNKKKTSNSKKINWCSGADDWGDEFGGDDDGFDTNNISLNHMQLVAQPLDDNLNEQNGNVVCNNIVLAKNENRTISDDEDESNSMDDPIPMFNNLQVIDDKNANCGEQQGFFNYLLCILSFPQIDFFIPADKQLIFFFKHFIKFN